MKRKGRKEAGYEEPEQPQASRAEVARVKPILGNWETTFWHWEEMFILLNPIFCKGNDPKMIDHVYMTRAAEGSPCICEAGSELTH